MILTNSWQSLGTVGVVIQKHGTADCVIAYNDIEPTTEDRFVLGDTKAQIFPNTGVEIWARAVSSNVSVTVQPLA